MDYYPDSGFPCFPSVVRRMLGYSSQRRGTVRTLTSAQRRVNGLLDVLLVLIVVVICILVCNRVPLSPGIHPTAVK